MKKTRQYYGCGKHEPSSKCPNPRVITAQEALTMLESAVSYCQSAGMKVQAINGDNGTLGVFIPGAYYLLTDNDTRAVFRLGAMSVHAERIPVANIGTKETAQDS